MDKPHDLSNPARFAAAQKLLKAPETLTRDEVTLLYPDMPLIAKTVWDAVLMIQAKRASDSERK